VFIEEEVPAAAEKALSPGLSEMERTGIEPVTSGLQSVRDD
jgi:hypothetical protein